MTSLNYRVQRTSTPTSEQQLSQILDDPGFGAYFTDHMVTIDWSEDEGWHNAQVRPYSPVELDPAATVFHYGQAIFEGIKAYRQADGSVQTFRPEANAERFARSARRLAMPELPAEEFTKSLEILVQQDKDWVPAAGGEAALYLRPFMIATEKCLGVRPSKEYRYMVIASPAGAYFADGVSAVSVWLSTEFVRAAPGGTGDAKFAGNYAASLLAQAQAEEKGCNQVVWIDAIERKYIEEMGGMNLMFVYGSGDDTTIVTPELSGSLLPGITRDSLLQVARDSGYEVQERKVSIDEWREGVANGEITEVFACGTAAVITPVGRVLSHDGEFTINDNQAGPVTLELRNKLTGIQRGTEKDTHAWLHQLAE